jgi:hypothetical protein
VEVKDKKIVGTSATLNTLALTCDGNPDRCRSCQFPYPPHDQHSNPHLYRHPQHELPKIADDGFRGLRGLPAAVSTWWRGTSGLRGFRL